MTTQYDARKLEAIESQGIDTLSTDLNNAGIDHYIDQTGGFNMVIVINLGDNEYPYLSLTREVLALTKSKNCDGNNILALFDNSNYKEITNTVKTALDHLNPLRENETIYICGICECEEFAVWQGEIVIQSGTYVEFSCNECAKEAKRYATCQN